MGISTAPKISGIWPRHSRQAILGVVLTFAATAPAMMTIQSPALAQSAPTVTEMTSALSDRELAAGWLSLFDGESNFGWQAISEADWSFQNSEISVSQGELGLLKTSAQFDDFELRLEFKADPQTNSGIFFRTSPQPQDPTQDCFEFNLASRSVSPFPTGSLVGRAACSTDFDVSDWTQVRIVADGNRIQGWIGDVETCDYTAPAGKALGRGYIGLQYNSGAIAFRKIRLLPLNLKALQLDAALSDWQTSESRASKFTVDTETQPAELHIQGGSGQLETKQVFGDFIFSTQCRTGGPGMNSGVFFRCIPGEFMNGYESQIQNQFKAGDRRQPVDCGTGGIFRRSNARIVNADDEQWFSKTIIACGPNLSVWVNGLQVTDWTDRRAPDPNPRQGRRLDAGTIILQGHDPGTDIRMREFKVRELSPRVR